MQNLISYCVSFAALVIQNQNQSLSLVCSLLKDSHSIPTIFRGTIISKSNDLCESSECNGEYSPNNSLHRNVKHSKINVLNCKLLTWSRQRDRMTKQGGVWVCQCTSLTSTPMVRQLPSATRHIYCRMKRILLGYGGTDNR